MGAGFQQEPLDLAFTEVSISGFLHNCILPLATVQEYSGSLIGEGRTYSQ